MSEFAEIEWRMVAEVNGSEFHVAGEGAGSRGEGTCEVHLRADPGFPEGLDPVVAPVSFLLPVFALFSRPVGDDVELRAAAGRTCRIDPPWLSLVHGAAGERLLDLRVSGELRGEDRGLVGDHRMTGTSRLLDVSRLITPFEGFVWPSGAGEATAVARLELETGVGGRLQAMSVLPFRWDEGGPGRPLVLRVSNVRLEGSGREQLSVYARSTVRPVDEDGGGALASTLPPGVGPGSELRRYAELSCW